MSALPSGVSARDYAAALRHAAERIEQEGGTGDLTRDTDVDMLREWADEAEAQAKAEWHDYSEWIAGRR